MESIPSTSTIALNEASPPRGSLFAMAGAGVWNINLVGLSQAFSLVVLIRCVAQTLQQGMSASYPIVTEHQATARPNFDAHTHSIMPSFGRNVETRAESN
jgi:hypothetical protein